MSENLRLMLAGKMTFNPSMLQGWEIELYEDITEYKERIEELEGDIGITESDLEYAEDKIEELDSHIEGLEREREEEIKGYKDTITELEGKLECCEDYNAKLTRKYDALLDSVSFD